MKRSAFYFYGSILPPAISFLINYYLSKNLSLQNYGSYGLYFSIINLVTPLIMFGQASAVTAIYFSNVSEHLKTLSKYLPNSLYILSGSFLLLLATLNIGKGFFPNINHAVLNLILVAGFAEATKQFFYSLTNCRDDFNGYFWSVNIHAVIISGCLYYNVSVEGYLVAFITSNLCVSAYNYLRAILHGGFELQLALNKKLAKELMVLGSPSILSMAVSSASIYYDRFIFKYFNSNVFPQYILASSLSVGIGLLGLSALLKGQTIRSLEYLRDQRHDLFNRLLKNIDIFLTLLCFIALILNFLYGKKILSLVFGSKFEAAFIYIFPLFINVVFLGCCQVYSLILIQAKRLHTAAFIQTACFLFGAVASFALSYFIGPKYIVVGLFLSNIAYFIGIYLQSTKEHKYYFPKYLCFVGIATFCIITVYNYK